MENKCLKNISVAKAIRMQHRLIELVCLNFTDNEFLSLGSVGFGISRDKRIVGKVEKIISDYFHSEDAVIVRGAGTGAISEALKVVCKERRKIIVHKSPIYSTTKNTLDDLNIKICRYDYNCFEYLNCINTRANFFIQHSRQSLNDSYDLGELIKHIKSKDGIAIVDDNYTAFKTEKIGCEYGADLSCFSVFKIRGPLGLGCVVGKKTYIAQIKNKQASGGTNIQDFEALEVLKAMIDAPVYFAHQTNEVDKLYNMLKKNTIKGIKDIHKVNMQSYVILVILENSIADLIIKKCVELGATNRPIGASSKYDVIPLFYTPSRSFIEENPDLINKCIRINPFQSGAKNVYKILKEAMSCVIKEFDL